MEFPWNSIKISYEIAKKSIFTIQKHGQIERKTLVSVRYLFCLKGPLIGANSNFFVPYPTFSRLRRAKTPIRENLQNSNISAN